MTPEEYFGKWSNVVDVKEAEKVLKSISKEPICPKLQNVFKSFELCDYDNLRVVIIGQEPYPQAGIATGIAFANSKETCEKNYSPSLKIIIDSVIDFSVPHKSITFDPSLESWEEQGVLMLNSALTCVVNKIGSHSLQWKPFISSLLENLSTRKTGIVYVLMGSDAMSYGIYISCNTNYIIKIPHPSYYARSHTKMPDIWSNINKILIKQNGYGIEWYKET